MKQNNNVSDFPEKIGSVDGPETEIIIKLGIRHTERPFWESDNKNNDNNCCLPLIWCIWL